MKLSIIIPVYNVEAYLSKCLDSAIYPELSDYEIVIVNDGSTDGSFSVAASYAKKYPALIQLISQENGGLGAARNTGIRAAKGEYLMFLDSDDYLTPNAVHEMLDILDGSFDICISDFNQVNSRGNSIGMIYGSDRLGRLSLEQYPELLFQAPAACNKLIRRSLFVDNDVYFPGKVWFEDLRTIPKLYLLTDRIIAVRRTWYNYLLREGSITNNIQKEKNLEIIAAVDHLLEYYRRQGKYEQYRSQLEYLAFYNQYLTSCTRVNLADRKSPIQSQLIDDYTAKYPPLNSNPYIRAMPLRRRLLTWLLEHRMFLAVNFLMRANNAVKGK